MKKYKLKLDYTGAELKELKELGKNYGSPMTTVWRVVGKGDCNGPFKNLREKYFEIKPEDEFDFMADINNVVMGTAIFPEPKKYYVHLIKGDSDSYLNYGLDSKNYYTSDKEEISRLKTQFTKEEIRAINPNYLLFIEEVPNDKLDFPVKVIE